MTEDTREDAEALARLLWADFTKDERTLVRFGMFPANKMPTLGRDGTRLLAVALMDCAKRDGGMRA
jgi:hypothetical protein